MLALRAVLLLGRAPVGVGGLGVTGRAVGSHLLGGLLVIGVGHRRPLPGVLCGPSSRCPPAAYPGAPRSSRPHLTLERANRTVDYERRTCASRPPCIPRRINFRRGRRRRRTEGCRCTSNPPRPAPP